VITIADLAELTTADNPLNDLGDPKIILRKLPLNLVEQGLVAQEHATTEGVAEKLTGELTHEIILALV
jgi:hypothetical protein